MWKFNLTRCPAVKVDKMTIRYAERQKSVESGIYSRTVETVRRQFPVYGPLPTWLLVSFFVVLVLMFVLAYASLYAFPKTLMAADEVISRKVQSVN